MLGGFHFDRQGCDEMLSQETTCAEADLCPCFFGHESGIRANMFILFYFILFSLFYFILFYFTLFYFISFYYFLYNFIYLFFSFLFYFVYFISFSPLYDWTAPLKKNPGTPMLINIIIMINFLIKRWDGAGWFVHGNARDVLSPLESRWWRHRDGS